MKATGIIQIQDLLLNNPILEIKGVFKSLKEDNTIDFLGLEIHFKSDDSETIHSRYWIIETNDINLEFSKIEELKVFK